MSLGAEDRVHQWLRRQLRKRGFNTVGDDGAVLSAGGPWAVTLDHQIEGVHFPSNLDAALIARRLLAVNLSDLAAMGAQPAYAFLALSCPVDFDSRRLLSSLMDACSRHGVELAGGDLAKNDRVTTSLTLLGRRPSAGSWLARDLARPGDLLWLAGALGLSALGRHLLGVGATMQGNRIQIPRSLRLSPSEEVLAKRAVRRHLVPVPQLEVGSWLARRRRAAAIDVSDGLALDLHRLCRESAVRASIEADQIRPTDQFRGLCAKLACDPHQLVVSGGEDYALLFATPERVRPPSSLGCLRIGRLAAGSGVYIETAGAREALQPAGWDHFHPA